MLTDQDHTNIERYLSRQLTGQDKADFEAELKARPELMAETRLQRLIQVSVQDQAIEKRKADLDARIAAANEAFHRKNKTRLLKPIWTGRNLAIAAASAAVLGFSTFLFFKENKAPNLAKTDIKDSLIVKNDTIEKTPNEPEKQLSTIDGAKLYKEFYEPIPQVLGDVPGDLNDAISAYQSKNYLKALEAIPELPNIEAAASSDEKAELQKNIDLIHLYKGLIMSHLKMNKASIAELNLAQKSSEARIKDLARWHMALIYVKTNELMDAENILSQIKEDISSNFTNEASRLLGKIKMKY